MYQRSADLGLGIPFNIASYALLTHMMAAVTDTDPHELIMQLGDAHVYQDHVEALKLQCTRTPRDFPTLKIKRAVTDIDDFRYEDFETVGYHPHPKIGACLWPSVQSAPAEERLHRDGDVRMTTWFTAGFALHGCICRQTATSKVARSRL